MTQNIKYQEIIDILSDELCEGFVIVNADGCVSFVNLTAVAAYRSAVGTDLCVGMKVDEIFRRKDHPHDDQHLAFWQNALRGQSNVWEYRNREGGLERCYRFRYGPVRQLRRDAESGSPMARCLIDDISADIELRKKDTIIDSCPVSIVSTDRDGNIEFVNPAFSEISGYTSSEVLGKNPKVLASGSTTEHEYAMLWRTILNGNVWRGLLQNKRKDGSFYWEEATIAPVFDDERRVSGFVAAKQDVTPLVAAKERVKFLSMHDDLTGLPNISFAREALEQSFNEPRKSLQSAVIFVDVDRLKLINDSVGRAAGDQVLRTIACRIRESLRPVDALCRYGGDEFLAIIPNVSSTSQISRIASNMLDETNGALYVGRNCVSVSISLGVALYPDDGTTLDVLLRKADLAMRESKRRGGGECRFYSSDINMNAERYTKLCAALNGEVQLSDFHLVFQPQVHLNDEKIIGCEALIRWDNPDFGHVSPTEFVPIAEASGKIRELGRWVLNEACSEAISWPTEIRLSVNVSPHQLLRGGFFDDVVGALFNSGLSASRLDLEITESALIVDMDGATDVIRKLNAIGVTFSIDDFGVGYSNFSLLRSLKFNRIKIDRSFVSNVHLSEEKQAIVRAITSMSKSLGITALAEGIEAPEELSFLCDLGCVEGQGYYFSRPITSKEIETYMSDYSKSQM